MPRYRLTIEYDGQPYKGFQAQEVLPSVQGSIERAVKAFSGQTLRLQAAGRTDTGVHASVQVVHFDTHAKRPQSAWVRGVNALLPRAVVVRWSAEVAADFHARYLACERQYRYILHNTPTRPAMLTGRVGWFHPPLDAARMAAAAECLVGTHDFSSFRAAGCQSKTPVRVMREARVTRQGEYLLFDFRANGFLHHMIRNLVGALVYVGKGHYPVEWMRELLEARDRARAAPTFAPDGLYLCGVGYPPRWPLPNDGRIIALPQLPLV